MSSSQQNQELERLWSTLEKISSSIISTDGLPYPFPLSSQAELISTLQAINQTLNLHYSSLMAYFEHETNANDDNDKLKFTKIKLASFFRRLGNFVIEKIYEQSKSEKSIKDFIRETRENQLKLNKDPSDSFFKDLKMGFKPEEILDRAKVEDIKEYASDIKSDSHNLKKSSIEPHAEKQESKPPKRSSDFHQVFSPEMLENHHIDLNSLYKSFVKKSGKLKLSTIPAFTSKIAETLNLQINDFHKSFLLNIIKSYSLDYLPNSNIIKLSYPEFSEYLLIWGEKYNQDKQNLRGKLTTTISEFLDLSLDYSAFSPLSSVLSSLTKSLEKALAGFDPRGKEKIIGIEETIGKNIQEIFSFYAKSQRIQGVNQTFEGMESSNSNWNLGKFLKFASDFDLIHGKHDLEIGLNKEQLGFIFKKTAKNSRLMDSDEFILAIDRIADVYYSPSYDKYNKSTYSTRSIEEKRKLLYKMLKLNIPNSYLKRVKAFAAPHTPKSQARIPYLEVKKLNYQYKMPESLTKQIEKWNIKKLMINNSTPPAVRPNYGLAKPVASSRKSANDLPVPTEGYAGRMGHKKKAAEKALNEDQSRYEDESMKFEDLSIVTPRPKLSYKNNTSFITMKALSNLEYQDLDDEFDLKELLNDNSVEHTEPLGLIDPKLQGILKMHDNKLAQGQKVVEKSHRTHKNL